MTDEGTTALRDQLAGAAERRHEDRRRLAELAALREQLTGRVSALEDEVALLRAVVTEATSGATGLVEAPALVPDVAPAPEAEPARPEPARRRLRLRPSLPGAMFAVGALAFADAVVTVVWQEPVSGVYGAWRQDQLDDDLAALDRSLATADLGLSSGQQAELRRASARQRAERRMVRLAQRFEQRLEPGEPIGRLRIGRLDESFVVVEGTGASALRSGPGRYSTGSVPGLDGTFGVAGHRTSWSAPFRRIDRLRKGDTITVTMPYGRFTYTVTTKRIVDPEDVWVLRDRSRARLVLTACHPLFSAAKRIVVSAELRSATPRGAALRPA